MLRLYQTTERWLTRLAFLLTCAVPTTAISAWCVYENLVDQAADCAQDLSSRWRMRVELGEVTRPLPRVTHYSGLRVTDPESGRIVISCEEITRIEHAGSSPWTEWRLTRPRLDAEAVPHLLRLATEWIEPGGSARGTSWAVTQIDDLQILGPSGERRSWTSGSALLAAGGEKAGVIVRLTEGKATADATGNGLRLEMTRARQNGGATRLRLSSGSSEIPGWLLSSGQRNQRMPLSSATFAGTLDGYKMTDGWKLERIVGSLVGVDLTGLVGSRFPPYRLEATADVDSLEIVFRDGRIASGKGRVTATKGRINSLLLNSAVEQLGLKGLRSSPSDSNQDWIEFERLQFAFRIGRGQLELVGEGGGPGSGTVLSGPEVVLTANSIRVPAERLASLLSPPGTGSVVASTETVDLLARLLAPR
jgi:hypothetical protein